MSTKRSAQDAVLERRLLDELRRSGRKGLETGDLAGMETVRELDASRDQVSAALAALERRGEAVTWNGAWLSVDGTGLVVGRAKRMPEGNVLVLPKGSREASHFVAQKNAHGAIDGDLVLAKPHKGGGQGKANPKESRGGSRRDSRRDSGKSGPRDGRHRLPEATITEIVERRNEVVVGTVEGRPDGRGGGREFVPFDPKADLQVKLQGAEDVPDGHFVVVELAPPKSSKKGSDTLRGRVVEVLGDAETPGVDVEVVLRQFRIPDEHPQAVIEAAESYPEDPGKKDFEGREDLRDALMITIDGITARDFDDAISVERLSADTFRLAVHIADVAHYVPEGGVIDLEAYRRGTSVYYPDRAIPMLPEALSNGLCSLRPDVPRLALSVFMDIDRTGEVKARRFAETVIASKRRMTYEEVRRILDQPRGADGEEYGEILPMLWEARELMSVLRAERTRRGSIDFDLPAGDIILDTDGTTVGIKPGERHVAHRIVEEFMIAANEAVAEELVTKEIPALYRVHEAPDPSRLEDLGDTLKTLGLELAGDTDALHPSALQAVMEQVTGTPDEPFVSTLVLRTMQQAHYSPDCLGHYALASRFYCHFTSPIRRYPDLVVHRSLKSLIRHGADKAREAAQEEMLPERLDPMAEHASVTERRAEQSERDLLQWKKVRFLDERVGETFTGRISGVQPFGMFVQLEDLYVDGLVPVRVLEDDYYVYEPSHHRLVGSDHGRVFQLADILEVRLTGVSVRHRGLDLAPTSMERSDRGDRGGGRERDGRGQGRKGRDDRGDRKGRNDRNDRGKGRSRRKR